MKVRLFAIVSLVAVLVLAAVPAFAQDDMQTIADIVVSSTGAETPEFTVLLAAVQAADPSILELLANPDANVTVFAPTDAAFAAALEALGVSAEDLLADTELLNNVLLYHVAPGSFDAASVVALNSALLGTMLNETALAVSVDGDAVKVNDSTVVAADVMAANGVVHVIDAVLLPEMGDDMMAEDMGGEMMEPAGNIAEVVIASTEAETPEFATLLAAVQAADPAILATLTGAGPYTVFAPTDAAFAAALEALGLTAEELLADTATLTSVLAYHVVPGHLAAETVVAVAGEDGGVNVATALPGTIVNVVASDMGVMVNAANVVTTDVHATNGIIHVIDAVLLPPAG
ncbi:MAG: fasciclin domain-containing protein [Anaerolineae bacterium]|nr:fasciclin domain-containing protein [Anaerolineae bacterium]